MIGRSHVECVQNELLPLAFGPAAAKKLDRLPMSSTERRRLVTTDRGAPRWAIPRVALAVPSALAAILATLTCFTEVAAAEDVGDASPRAIKETPTHGHQAPAELLDSGGGGLAAGEFQEPPSFSTLSIPMLSRHGVKIVGWLEQGVTINPSCPEDRSNLPVIFNDQANDYQLNQLWIHAGRPVRTDGHGLDIGGRIDLTYGTDSHFTTAHGLEDSWNSPGSPMQLAMPQLYAEVALNRFTMVFGRYLTPIGYEYTPAVPNFFYSHSYNFRFEPGTFTGTLATYRLTDQLQLSAGFQRGAQTWTPRWPDNDRVGVVAGGCWSGRDKRTAVQLAMSSNRRGPAGVYSENTYALVFQRHLTARLHYVFEQAGYQNVGHMTPGEPLLAEPLLDDVDFRYGTCQYLFYRINTAWKAGVRFSWNGYYHLQRPEDRRRQVENYNVYSATFGLNWAARPSVVVRPEIRIDWSDQPRFDALAETDQLLLAVDAILKF